MAHGEWAHDRFHRWFVFGESFDGRTVTVADGEKDVLKGISREHAEIVIEERDRILNDFDALARTFRDVSTEDFYDHWYGRR